MLGWVREPEKHPSNDSASVSFEQARTVFPPASDTVGVQGFSVLPGDPVADGDETEFTSAVKQRIANRPVEPGRLKTRDHAPPADSGGHEEAQHSAEPRAETRSRESEGERPLQQPEVKDRTVEKPERSQDEAVNTAVLTQQQPKVSTKERSTARSAAIVIGAAAAGAAIGGTTGGGKGAAIGAISGGAGGYVYDRMTRRKGVSATPPVSTSDTDQQDTDQQVDGPIYDRAPSFARRFGTPMFN